MRPTFVSPAALALLTALACNGTTPAPTVDAAADAPVMPDATADRAPMLDTPARDAGFDYAIPDLRIPPPDFGPVTPATPLPADGPQPQRLLPGKDDRLTGNGHTSCSNQLPASGNGDRWCSFMRPGATPAATELWVINMTKVAAGMAPACDGSSRDCLRMTTTLWTGISLEGPSHPYSHGFEGDTLIYYADAVSGPMMLHRGPVYGWRPGWTGPRKLTSDQGLMCFGHPGKALVHCLDDTQGMGSVPDSFELRAGVIETPPAAPLPSLGRIRPLRSDGQRGWGAAFSPDGATFVFSHPDPDPARETVRVVATKDLGAVSPRLVRHDVSDWVLGNDSQRLYYLRALPDSEGEFDLFASDLVENAAEVRLGTRVMNFVLLGGGAADDGVSYLVRTGSERGAFKVARDSRRSDSGQTIFSYRGLLEDVHLSGDLRYTAWLDEGFNARVVRHADFNSCRLNTHSGAAVFEPLFLHSGGLVFFNQDGAENPEDRDGLYARPDDCKVVQRFALNIDLYLPLGDRGILYTDERTLGDKVNLKYARAVRTGETNSDWRLEPPVLIRANVDVSSFTLVGSNAGSDPRFVIFRASADDNGVFVFGPLPL